MGEESAKDGEACKKTCHLFNEWVSIWRLGLSPELKTFSVTLRDSRIANPFCP